MPQAVVTAIGPDRPGIVAAVTRVLLEHGANIADSHMGLLSGRFSMMLVVEVPDGLRERRFAGDLEAAARGLGLDAIHAEYVGDGVEAAPPTHVVTVYGADHPGIVAAVTEALAAGGASVTDLRTRLAGELYVMTLEVSGGEGAEEALRAVAEAQSLDVTVRAIDADVL
ncbi:MAG: glycine cleavage system protein R [Solirubrobacteraceae bacterium]